MRKSTILAISAVPKLEEMTNFAAAASGHHFEPSFFLFR
jgi:hypothetical protein